MIYLRGDESKWLARYGEQPPRRPDWRAWELIMRYGLRAAKRKWGNGVTWDHFRGALWRCSYSCVWCEPQHRVNRAYRQIKWYVDKGSKPHIHYNVMGRKWP